MGTVTITAKNEAVLDAGAKSRLFCVAVVLWGGGHLVLLGHTCEMDLQGWRGCYAYVSHVTATDYTFSNNIGYRLYLQ
jgi:hypothetical protein